MRQINLRYLCAGGFYFPLAMQTLFSAVGDVEQSIITARWHCFSKTPGFLELNRY